MQSPASIVNKEIVRAGAGAGKTTQLTSKVIEAAYSYKQVNGAWPRFVVTTFTRKATQELRERLILKACEKGDVGLLRFVSSKSQLHISTIHGVLNLFLQRFGHLVGLDTSFSIINDEEANRIALRVLKTFIFEDSEFSSLIADYGLMELVKILRAYHFAKLENPGFRFYNQEQLDNSLLEVFKTFAEKLKKLSAEIQNTSSNDKWLQFAQELNEAYKFLSHAKGNEFANVLDIIGKKPSYSVKSAPVSDAINEVTKDILKDIKDFADHPLLALESWEPFLERYDKVKRLGEKFSSLYQQEKEQSASLEMQDLELLTLKILRDEPELGETFSDEWDYWLIDEFQDTSPVQIQILKNLIHKSPYYIVGDPQQSIYLFRGSRSEVFFNMIGAVKKEGGDVQLLQKNYRSEPELLTFFNDFFTKLNSEAFFPMEPKADLENCKKTVAKFLIAKKDDETDDMEFQMVTEQIIELLNQGVSYQDICILARNNSTLKSISQYLQEHGVPSYLYAASGFYSRREVKDALALLKFLLNPYDNKNLYELLRSPWFKVSDQILIEVAQQAQNYYWHIIAEKYEHLSTVHLLKRLLRHSHLKSGLVQSFTEGLVQSGILDFSLEIDSTGRRESNLMKLISIVTEFEKQPGANLLELFERGAKKLDLEDGSEEGDAVASLEPNRVQLMTVHSSKGLQFPHVFILKCEKKPRLSSSQGFALGLVKNEEKQQLGLVVPLGDESKKTLSLLDQSHLKTLDQRELEESQRLLYVALTRAKNCVYLSWSEGKTKLNKFSWAAQIPFPLTAGAHQLQDYCYDVITELTGQNYWKQNKEKVEYDLVPFQCSDETSPLNYKFSVSSLLNYEIKNVEGKKSELKDLVLKPAEGVLVHQILEILKYQPELDYEAYIKQQLPEKHAIVVKGVNDILNLEEPPLWDVIQNGETEWGYQLYTKSGLLEGQVDLWGTVGNTTWVIDYKSGSTLYKDKAFEQMEYYSHALIRYGVDTPIKMAVIYPLNQKVFVKPFERFDAIESELFD